MVNDRYVGLLKDDYKKSYSLFIKNKPMEAFSSHQPVLIHLLNTINEGPVLEFGMGYNSTPIMNLICGMQDRELISVETNREWFEKFRRFDGEKHRILYITKITRFWDMSFINKKYSVAFIDGSPASLRQPLLEKIKDTADYIIVHDSECVVNGIRNCYEYDFSMFKHVHHLTTSLPMTSLLSNLDVFDERLLEIF